MANNSKIEWTQATWNPITGCDKVSQGCKNCYAEIMHRRLMKMHPRKYSKPFLGNIQWHIDDLKTPTNTKKPTVFFVNSMSDLWHKDVPFDFIDAVFSEMSRNERHTFQILTKRPEIALKFFNARAGHAWTKNVWIGVSVEDQKAADERIPLLLQIPAAIRFLSCEPLLGPIDLIACTTWPPDKCPYCDFIGRGILDENGRMCPECSSYMDRMPMIDWVIVGGESGHKARPMHPDWVRAIRDQCNACSVPFFFKQWGQWGPEEKAIELLKPDQALGVFHHIHIYPDGKIDEHPPYQDIDSERCQWMFKLGKHAAGNTIDGKIHLAYP